MITLYDLECPVPGVKTMSPFVIKVRIALNYKKIPHRSVFLSHPELKQRAEELGLPTNDLDGDNPPRHKVPIIHDDSTGQSISDSTRILAYLDKTYPNTPALLAPGTETAAVALDKIVSENMMQAIMPAMGARLVRWLGAKIGPYRGFVEQKIGMTVEEFFINPETEEKYLKSAEERFSVVAGILKKARVIAGQGEDAPFQNGSTLTYGDVAAGCMLFYIKACYSNDEEIFKRVIAWDGGRWGKLHEALLPYVGVSE